MMQMLVHYFFIFILVIVFFFFLTLRKYKQAQPHQEGDEDTPPLNAIETFYGVHCRDGAWQNQHDEAAYVSVLLYIFISNNNMC